MADTVRTSIMKTNAQGTFTYDLVPLHDPSTSIRLLQLCPAQNFADDLQCRIYVRPLGETGKYYALSYTWGENKKTHEISIINFPRESKDKTRMQDPLEYDRSRTCAKLSLPITASLDICLRHLRRLFCSQGLILTIWIDQICINQDFDDEKSHQVRLMKNIYSTAYEVLAWLGPSGDHSDEVMDMWSQILETMEQMMPWQDWSLRRGHLPPLDYSTQPATVITDKAFELFGRFNSPQKLGKWQSRAWFSRVWIIQEFCLSGRVLFVCGDKAIRQTALTSSVLVLGHANMASPDFRSPALADKMNSWRAKYREWITSRLTTGPEELIAFVGLLNYADSNMDSLLELLVNLYTDRTINLNATQYRDRVYGLLGLASDADELGIVPDYSGTSTAEVLTQIARAIIEKGRPSPKPGFLPSLAVLRYAQFPKTEPKDMEIEATNQVPLPTWVPDWRNKLTESFERKRGGGVGRSYSPCGNSSKAEVVPTSNSNVLGLRGYLVDIIEERGNNPPIGFGQPWIEFAGSMGRLWLMSINKKPAVYQTALRHFESLWRTPIGDSLSYIHINESLRKRRAVSTDIEVYRRFLEFARDLGATLISDTALKIIDDGVMHSGYLNSLGSMSGKRPYLTEKGYLGMGPKHAEPGDLVVIFYGDIVAYVIRPAPEHGENMYTLVGEAYCDGIMDGEIADTAEKRDFFLV
ncbi:heterokaryon incompatibility protein [Copromyces sp. CBS 386.78]|nr:heterokaryon incompatibility protein [Copromyces sp. CBS 386.78]